MKIGKMTFSVHFSQRMLDANSIMFFGILCKVACDHESYSFGTFDLGSNQL